jgi:hypothetical protein
MENERQSNPENVEVVDVTQQFLELVAEKPSEFKDVLDSMRGKKVKLVLNMGDATPEQLELFFKSGVRTEREVVMKATKEEKEQYETYYPEAVKWERVE